MKSTGQKVDMRFTFLTVMFISLMLISNLLAVKVITVFGITMTPGIFIYPFSFMLGDVLTELYGFKNTKRVIWIGFLVQASLIVFSQLAIISPYPPFWEGQEAMELVFGTTPQIVIGSLAAFVLGGLVNSKIMDIFRVKHEGKHLWFRTILSSIFGEIVDSLIFVPIAFLGRMPIGALLLMIVTQVVVKTLIEAVFGTPLAYYFIHRAEVSDNKAEVLGVEVNG